MADDKSLIFRARAGDEQAFADLVGRYHAFVYGVVIGIIKNVNDAEEVVQDVFFNTYRGLPQLEDTTKFKGWLAEIARNCARDRMRKRRVDTVPIDEVSEHTLQTPDALDARLIRDEQRALIRSAMESLSDKDKEIAQAYYLDGESYDELIRTHGLSYKAISFRLSRAKRKLSIRLHYLLTGVFISPATTFKQLCTGGLTIMKIGTIAKLTVSAAAIIGLGVVGTHQFILSKEDERPSVEIVTSTPNHSIKSIPRTDSTRKALVSPRNANSTQISFEEMEQIERFFSQLEAADAQDMGLLGDETTPSDETISKIDIESEQEISENDATGSSEHQERIAEIKRRIEWLSEQIKLVEEEEETLPPPYPPGQEPTQQMPEEMERDRKIDTRRRELRLKRAELGTEQYHLSRELEELQQEH